MMEPPRAPRGGAGSDVSRLRVALAGAWGALLRPWGEGRGGSAPLRGALALLEAVGGAAPGALRFRHWARLRLGLQAAVVMQLLREAQPDARVCVAIERFFPEGEAPPPGHAQASPRELAMVAEAQENFRELVLGLLGDRARREAYLQGRGGRDYGRGFRRVLQRLFLELLRRLESALPPPDPAQLHWLVWSHAPPGPRPRELPILRRYLADVGHAHCGAVPRPLLPAPPPRAPPPALAPPPGRAGPRPRRRLRPLLAPPLEFEGDVSSTGEGPNRGQARAPPPCSQAPPPPGEFPAANYPPAAN